MKSFGQTIKIFLFAAIIMILFLVACDKEEPAKSEPEVIFELEPEPEPEPEEQIVNVNIYEFIFSPDNITINPGTTVVWTNADDYRHFIRTINSGFQSPILNPGDKFNLTFFDGNMTYKYVEPGFGALGYITVK